MPKFSEVAHSNQPTFASDDHRDAWFLWRSVVEEWKRTGSTSDLTPDGRIIYNGTFRRHVKRLWPMLEDEERRSFEKRVYSILNAMGVATCVQKKSPTIWWVTATWPTQVQITNIRSFYRPSRTEMRLTPEEAGETLPPGEVTVRKKEPEVINSAIQELHKQKQLDREARRLALAQYLEEHDEPLTVDELAALVNWDPSTVRKDLQFLEENGLVVSRSETSDERILRYGGERAYARRALLYSLHSPVPPRTKRIVVDGVVPERAERAPAMNPDDINDFIARKLVKFSPRKKFTSQELASAAHVTREAARVRLNKLVEAQVVVQDGFKGGAKLFRVVDRDRVQTALGVRYERQQSLPLPQQTVAVDLVTKTKEILADNEKLRKNLGQRNAEVDQLKKRVAELEAELNQLKNASVDPDLMKQLQDWTPSE